MSDDAARPWIADWGDREAEDERLGAVLRGTPSAVRYVELPTFDGEPQWRGGAFDSIDYGVEIDYGPRRAAGLIWRQRGYNEGLLVTAGGLASEFGPEAQVQAWDVTDRWRSHGGRAIVAVASFWSRAAFGPAMDMRGNVVGEPHESDFQLDGVRLTWDTGREFVVVLGERRYPGGEYRWIPDNVCVFTSVADAVAHRVRLEDAINL